MVPELPWGDIIQYLLWIFGLLAVVFAMGHWKGGIEQRLDSLKVDFTSISLAMNVIIKTFIDLSKRLSRAEKISAEDIVKAFEGAALSLSGGVAEVYLTSKEGTSNPNIYRNNRKRELWDKAQRKEISRAEADELKRLLEEQERAHEASGDFVGAILVGLLFLGLLGIIASLFGERE